MGSLTHSLLTHYKRYEKMQIEDFVKLIHQQTFGPKHYFKHLDKKTLLAYLKQEIKSFEYYPKTPLIESIGNHYFRVSLLLVIKEEQYEPYLIDAFYDSMKNSPENDNNLKLIFIEKLTVCLNLILNRVIDLDYAHSKAYIEQYLKQGTNALHHSDLYRELYHPHYRVVAEKELDLYFPSLDKL